MFKEHNVVTIYWYNGCERAKSFHRLTINFRRIPVSLLPTSDLSWIILASESIVIVSRLFFKIILLYTPVYDSLLTFISQKKEPFVLLGLLHTQKLVFRKSLLKVLIMLHKRNMLVLKKANKFLGLARYFDKDPCGNRFWL